MDVDCMKDGLAKRNPASRKIPLDATAIDASEKPMGFSLDAQMQDKSPLEKPKSSQTSTKKKLVKKSAPKQSEFIRAENEDDDGYDPYSDRRPEVEPLFERDPWM
ncbi:hypothetical protein [Lancefieldella rimae]|uniref:Uncharacterized protein n=3 Tax=Lancefieldella rimae TaxID=1383 RepID=B9CM97_LANR4|nr:hypothetical protein [Lancefieldella rimae]EEE17231.1 hypothetical protein ATORI0001_1436 [Lancefieldella rimae ATCC 49626]KRO02393.1 hypothetical protein IV60_GL000829 [Lancefieldella rimae]